MNIFDTKTYVSDEGLEIRELIPVGDTKGMVINNEQIDLEDDAHPVEPVMLRFVALHPTPVQLSANPPIVVLDKAMLPLVAQTIQDAFTEYANKMKDIKTKVSQKANQPSLVGVDGRKL